ncbi:hypothetical protein E4U19_007139 [Claviceps sp. Clav32 group G5]|nr:hypothetical protein E4U19_007139 [Claviceps sp. Clav32 group G5]KAG6042708.1 hypothetical protein E4U39_005553 [Claviceps sp. Clav50 group G5]
MDDWIEALLLLGNSLKVKASGLRSIPTIQSLLLMSLPNQLPRVATSDECNEFTTKHSTPNNPVTLHDAIRYHNMLYQEQVRRYMERAVHSWMASTVLPSIHASVLAKIRKDNSISLDTPRQLAKELKAKFAQDPVVSSAATSSRYKDLLHQAHVANIESERWIADWNFIYQKAISQDILEVKGPNDIRDFLRAVGNVLSQLGLMANSLS